MNADWSKTISGVRKSKSAGGLVIPAMVAALLMAVALVGCDGSADTKENVSGLPAHAEAVGQDNGSLTDTLPTVSEFERLERHPGATPVAVDHTPRAIVRYDYSGR